MLQAGSVQIVYRFVCFPPRYGSQCWTPTREQEARGRERGEGKQSDSKAANRNLRREG